MSINRIKKWGNNPVMIFLLSFVLFFGFFASVEVDAEVNDFTFIPYGEIAAEVESLHAEHPEYENFAFLCSSGSNHSNLGLALVFYHGDLRIVRGDRASGTHYLVNDSESGSYYYWGRTLAEYEEKGSLDFFLRKHASNDYECPLSWYAYTPVYATSDVYINGKLYMSANIGTSYMYGYQYKTVLKRLGTNSHAATEIYYNSGEVKTITNGSGMYETKTDGYYIGESKHIKRLWDGSSETFDYAAGEEQEIINKSTYNTVWGIADTNDRALCDYLGIDYAQFEEKHAELDTENQTWNTVDSAGNVVGTERHDGYQKDDSLSPIENLTIKLVGDDSLIEPLVFNNYYAGHVGHSNMLGDLNTPVWGLGNLITWEYNGKLFGSTGSTLLDSDGLRRLRFSVRCKFRIDSQTVRSLTYVINDYGFDLGISPGDGYRKISFYDLCLYFQSAYPEIKDFPSQLMEVTYYLQPYYYSKADHMFYYGNTYSISQDVKSALSTYAGNEWDYDNDGWSNVEDTSDFEWIWQDISNGVSSVGKFLRNMVASGKDILIDMGQIPKMIGELFSFMPGELVTLIGIGLSLWFLPALLGLAKQAMATVGNVVVATGGAIAKLIQTIVKAF